MSWIEPTIAGQPDPDHPAPILKLAPDGDAAPASGTPASTAPVTAAISSTKKL